MGNNIDFNQLMSKFQAWLNKTIAKVEAYFKSLTQYETYAWIAEGVGFLLVLIALVTW